MNLARVEYYFSDVLSIMETRKLTAENSIITNNLVNEEVEAYSNICIPENLYIIGTVNMDETTFQFSKKVLDRASAIEFNQVDLEFDFDNFININKVEPKVIHNNVFKSEFINLAQCIDHKEIAQKVIAELTSINKILQKDSNHFAYRIRDEIVFYCIYAEKLGIPFHEVLDYCIKQKIITRIGGSSKDTFDSLINIFAKLTKFKSDKDLDYIDSDIYNKMEKQGKDSLYTKTSEKLLKMIWRYSRDGFTTFWE
jgi:hypothetical protein